MKPKHSVFYKCLIKRAILYTICLFLTQFIYAQDTTRPLLDLNNTKLVKKINSFLDSNQKKINRLITDKADSVQKKINNSIAKNLPKEIEKPLPYERLLNTKYTLARRAYQNTTSQFNYYFNAEEELNEMILNARIQNQDDYTELLTFYDYDLNDIAKYSIDSIIYRCNANIVLHDLRNNWIDDAYLLMAKAYLFHKNFDTAGSILQFINYSFDEKENGADLPIGSNIRDTKGKFSIATLDNNRIWENDNIRNESMVWQARNFFETGAINEGISLLQLLKSDAFFPKRLHPFLYEQLAYGYYQMEMHDSAANYLIKALPHAIDGNAKARWYFLIAQLYDKSDKKKEAYYWFQKASNLSINPILGVYAKINMIQYELQLGNENWIHLANQLEKLTKKDKYKPYSDIIYFEIAKLAIQNKAFQNASDWLIASIKTPSNSSQQRQKAFVLLGAINYDLSNYALSKMAYDSVTLILKTNPLFEQIQLRKKWLSPIQIQYQILNIQDTLECFYLSPNQEKEKVFAKWKQQFLKNEIEIKSVFREKELSKDYAASSQINMNNNISTIKPNSSNFYFENNNTVHSGKKNFVQKWGDRPNVDNWRRKTSLQIAYNNATLNQNNPLLATTLASHKDNSQSSTNTVLDSNITMLENETAYQQSLKKWNQAAIKTAELFLLELNDFDKALPIFQKIIAKDIEPSITERALLDIASQYIHLDKKSIADSIIQSIVIKYPNGFYINKKKNADAINSKKQTIDKFYTNAYLYAQIGDWKNLTQLKEQVPIAFSQSKWNVPYQFLQVKMYAQLKQDSLALVLLDELIFQNQNELIREKAKNIIKEIKQRKNTEAYLSNLQISLPVNLPIQPVEELINITTSNPSNNLENKSAPNQVTIKDSTNKASSNTPQFTFLKDSIEAHYMAIVTNKVKEVFVKECQTAFNYLNNEEFNTLQLNTTYVQFDDQTYVLWIGPFENQAASLRYMNTVKPKLSKEIISFIPEKQYEIYIFGKSNILRIQNSEDLKTYRTFMLQNIIK